MRRATMTVAFVLMFAVTPHGFAAGTAATPEAQADLIANVDARLQQHAEAGTFSGSVLIARGGDALLSNGYSFADRENEIPNTDRTQFNICSMGKMFTAAAIMLLVEDGEIDLKAPISTYLADFSAPAAQQITVHHLLSHTAGLGNYMADRDFERNMAHLTTIEQVYKIVEREELAFPPGTRFSYSNSGYIVLGRIIEVVTGRSYFDFVRERIFAPLGMDETEFYLVSERPADVAFGYTQERGDRFARERHRAPNPYSDGGVHSTVGDLLAFDRALHEATLLSPDSRDLMFTPNLNGYGYGLSIKPPEEHASGRTSIGHTGGLEDRSAVLRHFVDDDTVIIVLSNLPAIAFDMAREIEQSMYAAAPETQARLAPGDHELALDHRDRERTYLVHAPPMIESGEPLPVVINFHGGGGNAAGHKANSRMDEAADRDGYIAVYPNGTGVFRSRLLTWNAGTCCGYARDRGVDDVGFVIAMLDDLGRRTPIDRARVYATGLSNGGMMAYQLAVQASDQVAAIAPVGGAMVVTQFEPTRAVPVLHIHSVDDPRALYEGGLGPPFPLTNNRTEHPSVEAMLELWVEANDCDATPWVGETRYWTAPDGATHSATPDVFSGCSGGAEVALWRLTGAGHVWPGGTQGYLPRLLGPSTEVIDANTVMWEFFSSFRLPEGGRSR